MPLIKSRTSSAAPARAPSAARFKYQARSAEEVKARATRSLGGGEGYLKEGVEKFAPSTGVNTIRILPPTWADARHYGVDVHVHFGIGPDRSAYLDLDRMKGEPDPINEERIAAAEAGEEDLAKALRSKQRVLVWLIDRKNEEKGPLAWSMPAGLDKDFVNGAIDPDTGEVMSLDDPSENGYDISFTKSGEGIKTEYTAIRVSRKPSPLSDDQEKADKWLQYVSDNPLPEILVFKTYDELKTAYAGTTVEAKGDKGGDKKGKEEKKVIPPRGAARPAAAPAEAAAEAGEEELPTWKEVHEASEADVTELVEAKGLTKEAEADASLDSLEKLADWVCARLGIAAPAPAKAASGGSWKDRLKKGK